MSGSSSSYTSIDGKVMRTYIAASARRYLRSPAARYSSTISRSGWICSSLHTRHRNGLGRSMPYVPPTYSSSTALSMSVSAVSAKQSCFQYIES